MYKYNGYVIIKDTGASMPFKFECKHFAMSEQELLSYIGNELNETIQSIIEYKVSK